MIYSLVVSRALGPLLVKCRSPLESMWEDEVSNLTLLNVLEVASDRGKEDISGDLSDLRLFTGPGRLLPGLNVHFLPLPRPASLTALPQVVIPGSVLNKGCVCSVPFHSRLSRESDL